MLWVHDPVAGTDLAYNWGIFDFEQSDFLVRFLQGRMRYWMEAYDVSAYVAFYARTDRSIWLQRLNLTAAQQTALRQFLAWNAEDANKYYRYDYYRDNCSTRVRDALDRVLAGAIRQQTERAPTRTTFRSHTRRLTAAAPVVYTGLMLALGPDVDQPLSAWDEGFIPMQLQAHLRQVTVPDEAGRPVPLVQSERTVFQSDRFVDRPEPPHWTGWYLLLGTLLGAAMALLGRRQGRGARRAFRWLAMTWALVTGLAGLLLAGLWAFTDHLVTYRNVNLFQLTLAALAAGILLPGLGGAAPWRRRALRALGAVVGALALMGLAWAAWPGMVQVNGEMTALLLPGNLGLAAGLWAATTVDPSETPAPPQTA